MIALGILYQERKEHYVDPFVAKTQEYRKKNERKISGEMVETEMVETESLGRQGSANNTGMEIHRSPAQDEDPVGRGTEKTGTRRLSSEPTLVERGQNFATKTGTFDQEEVSTMSEISTGKAADEGSSTDHTMMRGDSEKAVMSSFLYERLEITLENMFPFTR